MDWQDKKILIIGLARSGMAAIRLLRHVGARNITLVEEKAIDNKEVLEEMGVEVCAQSPEVFARDFDIVIKNPGVSPTKDFILDLKERNIPVITEVELAYQIAKPQHYIAITGTNGKTTTTTLVYQILEKAYGNMAHVAGNIGVPLSELVLENRLDENEGHYIALELSNGQLVDIDTFHPDVATIINMTPDHIDFMGGLDAYYQSKTRIYKNMSGNDVFLLNSDDEIVKEYTKKYPPTCTVKRFSLGNENADAYYKKNHIFIEGNEILDITKVTLPGLHNIQNILIAAYACYFAGVSKEDIQDVVYNFKGVAHRIEFVREVNGVKYYNDSKATNTDATITALKSFDKNVILLVGGFEKGLSMEDVIPYLRCVKKVIGFGDAGDRIADDLVGNQKSVVQTLKDAIDYANQIAESGDIVLLSPTTSSFDQYKNFEERGNDFKRIVEEL